MPNVLDECWEWNGCRDKDGYGIKMANCYNWRTHRFAWTWANGPIPKGMMVLHRCDNPPCCNPRHLFLGTNTDNMRDRSLRGRDPHSKRTHCPQGHAYAEHGVRKPNGHRRCLACHRELERKRYTKVLIKGNHNRAKTHCFRGHPFDAANTYVTSRGHRQCRTCRSLRRNGNVE